MSDVFILGVPNGAGKTTTALTLFPRLDVAEFVNADAIAAGISPLNPVEQARTAGRLMLQRLDELSQQGLDFAFETTLASRSFVPFVRALQARGYAFHLIYIWLETPDLAVSRVAKRVASGRHDIPEATIRRRFEWGLSNFFQLYLPIADTWTVMDNTDAQTRLVAQGGQRVPLQIWVPERWQLIKTVEWKELLP